MLSVCGRSLQVMKSKLLIVADLGLVKAYKLRLYS
jgi:hypothetical protein